jgi:hypothetical protein
MQRVAIATCSEVPQLDEDGDALLHALSGAGIHGVPCVWDDPQVAWGEFSLVLVRSTWDYAGRSAEFLQWASRVQRDTPLANPAEVIAWNIDKRYLRDLERRGVPVVETHWPSPGEGLPDLSDFVVKPSVSAGCIDTGRFRRPDEAALALAELIHASGRTVMVQPYMPSVDEHGETALLFFGGAYSHSIRKGGMLEHDQGLETALFRAEDIRSRVATAGEVDLANRVLDAVPFRRDRLTYARVDLVLDSAGHPRVLEVELTEPSVFLGYDSGAAALLARAVAGHPALATDR